ncbi:MAG TPA: hypothetical protein VFA30_05580 [Gaiellaceae bacterium]|nr:hypothetical protein [Gaiellaceae bacterium]
MRRLVLACALVAVIAAGTARADGDPASDYLLGTQVFIPFDLKLTPAQKTELTSLVHAANTSGYTIRVALIGSAYDLGSVTSLWGRPKEYARFLGAELQFVYKNRLLVVMPHGFGFNWPKHSPARGYAALATIPIGPGAVGLQQAATKGVQALARSSGVKIVRPVAAASGGHSMAHDRIVIILAAVAALAVAVLLRLALRRKDP